MVENKVNMLEENLKFVKAGKSFQKKILDEKAVLPAVKDIF